MILYYLIMVLPIVAIASVLVYLPVFFIKKKQYGKRTFSRHVAIYTLIGVVLSILYATILIYGFDINFCPAYYFLNLIPFVWIKETYEMGVGKMIEQLLMNIVMLIPLGFILPIVFKSVRKWWKTGLTILSFIFLIETFQYFIGRSADIDDVIMNTFGGLIGYGLSSICNHSLESKKWWKNACNDI
ncbi:VanZ family protein [Lachnospiraceae bacterium LCP25S3_G4]